MVRTLTGKCVDCGKPCSQEAQRCRSCCMTAFNGIKWRGHKKYPPEFCIDCGKQLNKGGKRCAQCRDKYMQERPASKHPSWKGGRLKIGEYWEVYMPSHPRAGIKGYVYEHILAWEQASGKSVPKGWHIHHLNGIKTDNRSINLIALSSKKHKLVLEAKAKRIQELEAMLNNQYQLL